MKKIFLVILLTVMIVSAYGQAYDSLSAYINTNIATNGTRSITGAMMNKSLNDLLTTQANAVYDTSRTYVAGQWCMYDDDVYRCSATTTGAFDANDWVKSSGWSLNGNAIATDSSDFIGSTNNVSMVFKTNNTERMRIRKDGKIGLSTIAPKGKLDISDGGISLFLGAENNATTRTNTTTKNARIAFAPYTNSHMPFAGIFAQSQATTNVLNIGGGSTQMYSATGINFVTAANNTTVVGTAVGSFNSSGNFSLKNGGAINEFSTDTTLGGNSDLAVPTEKSVKTYIDNRVPQIYNKIINLSSAQILAGSAIDVADAPGANKRIQVLSASIFYSYGTITYTGQNGTVFIEYESDGPFMYSVAGATQLLNNTTSKFIHFSPTLSGSVSAGMGTDQKLRINQYGALTNGDGTAKVYITYTIIDL